uniref:Uncharacterized protein n=1 Tax=Anguilla anguilla TaxID=7936 RepID=A0A0E9S3F2_ANGAN
MDHPHSVISMFSVKTLYIISVNVSLFCV